MLPCALLSRHFRVVQSEGELEAFVELDFNFSVTPSVHLGYYPVCI